MTTRRIAVVAPEAVPPVEGGAERHWRSLIQGLRSAGYEADLVSVATPESTPVEIVASYRRFHELDVSAYDAVISGKYPSWMVRHPHHVRHLNHPLRGLYDTYPADLPNLGPADTDELRAAAAAGIDALLDTAEAMLDEVPADHPRHRLPGPFIREVVHLLDAAGAAGIRHHAAVSETVAGRTDYLPDDVTVTIVAPVTDLPAEAPTPSPAPAASGSEPSFVVFGRLDPPKRVDLAIRGFATAGLVDARLHVIGTGPELERLRDLTSDVPGVEFHGYVSDDELADRLARATAAVLTAKDEDYGLVAAEAFRHGCPVIATTDGGGVAEQVLDAGGGWLCAPDRWDLAATMRRVATTPDEARRRGAAGRRQVADQSWSPLFELLEAPPETARPTVTVLSSYSGLRRDAGGPQRVRALADALTRDHEVVIVSLDNDTPTGEVRRRRLPGGIRVVSVGRSAAHRRRDFELSLVAERPVDDLALARLSPLSPAFARELAMPVEQADVIVLAQPYLAAVIGAVSAPVVYDAHNVERTHKAMLHRGLRGAERFVALAHEAELLAVERAEVVAAVAEEDAEALRNLGAERVVLAPNGWGGGDDPTMVPPPVDPLPIPGVDGRPVVLFVGSDHGPNHDAADRLVELAELRPDLAVVLAGSVGPAGRGPTIELGRYGAGEEAALFAAADVVVNPVRSGGGSNLKLGPAVDHAVPLVTTRHGARGWPAADRWAALVDDDVSAIALAEAVDDVLADPVRARTRAATARHHVADRHWRAALGPLVAAIDDLTGQGRRVSDTTS